ncbi:class I SAM-dependent methyltransferase [Anabaenopsis elenkinii]|uniref:Class I SAM-dependent methyltransferase n=1 Tax=Anabaenopsis elenkinii CCIBt3563 TaxID=2779889 RepID=A0A7S6U6B7_9CYAN|nr:class I SAM-dependent methyltransferase [Anabaenopsis elenkinii]QOV23339.1 class I SAM-dependent methyltransferase [Anabaenopsis elenkinii CCIBt3563]
MSKLSFLIFILDKYLRNQSRDCPHCGSKNTILKQRKKLLIELRECQDCFLMYRYPKDTMVDNFNFYQLNYQEAMTTDLPNESELKQFLSVNFSVAGLDGQNSINIIKQYVQGGMLLDYGCSYGYMVSQFIRAGYNSIGFEISKPRAEYGRKNLNLSIIDSFQELDQLEPNSFDIIHSSHVLEHLPDLKQAFFYFKKLLKPTGYLVIFVPNGGGSSARNLGVNWGPLIGEKHNLALNAKFFHYCLSQLGFSCVFNSSNYYDSQPVSYESEQQIEVLTGDELLVIATPIESKARLVYL